MCIYNYGQETNPENKKALKTLAPEMEKLCGMVSTREKSANTRKRYPHNAILDTERVHHAHAKITNSSEFGETFEILHEPIESTHSLKWMKAVTTDH